MPAGNPLSNTLTSFPSAVDVGRGTHTQQLLAHSVPTERRRRPDDVDETRRTAAVPTNAQRRATAKRKLERQLERRAAQARRQRLFTIIGASVGVLLVIGAIVATVIFVKKDSGAT